MSQFKKETHATAIGLFVQGQVTNSRPMYNYLFNGKRCYTIWLAFMYIQLLQQPISTLVPLINHASVGSSS